MPRSVALPQPRPGAGEGIGQANGGAIVDPDAGEALEQRDGHRIRCDHLLHARVEHRAEQISGGGGKPAVNGLWRDIHTHPVGHLGQLLDGRGRVGEPAINQGLNERTGGEFGAVRPFDVGERRRNGLGGGGQEGLHGLAQVGYDRHWELLGIIGL